jgi:hypothetical protein
VLYVCLTRRASQLHVAGKCGVDETGNKIAGVMRTSCCPWPKIRSLVKGPSPSTRPSSVHRLLVVLLSTLPCIDGQTVLHTRYTHAHTGVSLQRTVSASLDAGLEVSAGGGLGVHVNVSASLLKSLAARGECGDGAVTVETVVWRTDPFACLANRSADASGPGTCLLVCVAMDSADDMPWVRRLRSSV